MGYMPEASAVSKTKSILELPNNEAKTFFLKAESYCSLDLPLYITFEKMITEVDTLLSGKDLSDYSTKPSHHYNNNYTIFSNKDGRYSWRPFQLIHPALYVSLVHKITEQSNWKLICDKFTEFSANEHIKCLSLPIVSYTGRKNQAEQILNWWHEVEQKSIEYSLEYEYLIETDITDCYGSIYTHSIAWALHTKLEAKKRKGDKTLIGNVIDNHIQDMRHGQTNGIPQGSVLMDFIAEIVLGFADLELSQKLDDNPVDNYRILRYRDDYRIFVKNPQVGEKIVKLLTETAIELGLKLNATKTKSSNDVIQASIKSDKLGWLNVNIAEVNFQKKLLIIYGHAKKFPNSGSLAIALADYHKKILDPKLYYKNPLPLISIITEIAYQNPRTYSVCSAIISRLLSFIHNVSEKEDIIKKIKDKFSQIPNTGHMQIWLQRVSLPIGINLDYDESICKLASGQKTKLWNSDWISYKDLKNSIENQQIIDQDVLNNLDFIILLTEFDMFTISNNY